jgi:hypothetical protein
LPFLARADPWRSMTSTAGFLLGCGLGCAGAGGSSTKVPSRSARKSGSVRAAGAEDHREPGHTTLGVVDSARELGRASWFARATVKSVNINICSLHCTEHQCRRSPVGSSTNWWTRSVRRPSQGLTLRTAARSRRTLLSEARAPTLQHGIRTRRTMSAAPAQGLRGMLDCFLRPP